MRLDGILILTAINGREGGTRTHDRVFIRHELLPAELLPNIKELL